MLHRRPGASVSSQASSSSPTTGYSASSGPTPPLTGNTAYTPLKRRESAQLYPAPGSASGSKARYPLPSPGAGSGAGASLSGVGQSNALGLSSPINIIGGQGHTGYLSAAGSYGGSHTYDLSRHDEGEDLKERLLSGVRQGLERARRGLEDALRLDRSWNLVWNDAELKLLILKSSAINLLSLLLLSFFSVVVSPSLGPALSDASRTKEIGMWYNLLLSWPVFAVCFWINASWGPDISRRAQTLLHPSYRHQPSPSSTPQRNSVSLPSVSSSDPSSLISPIFKAVARVILIADFTLVSRLVSLVPLIGRLLAFAYMSIITSYYCFEWNFANKGWTLSHRVVYVQERTAYMIGFGALATFITSLGSPLVNMSIFALLYPFFVLQALLSRPPVPRSSALPNTPSPGASMPPSPMEGGLNLTDPFFSGNGGGSTSQKGSSGISDWRQIRVPLFFFARYGLAVLDWFQVALERKLGGTVRKERSGKRLG